MKKTVKNKSKKERNVEYPITGSLLLEGAKFNESKTQFWCEKCGADDFKENMRMVGNNFYGYRLECTCCGNPVSLIYPIGPVGESEEEVES